VAKVYPRNAVNFSWNNLCDSRENTMNERILKLAEQAGFLNKDEESIGYFAELIVKECAAIADTERPNSVGCGYITKTKGMLIREHFGVEE
jgi:hypothetical protein